MKHLTDVEKVLLKSGLDYQSNKVIDDYFLTSNPNAVRDSYRCCQEDIADKMIQMAELHEDYSMCEPGAGKGVILKHMVQYTDHYYFEINMHFVVNYLAAISKNFEGVNFFDTTRKFDRIVINPPFAFKQYIKHILFAYEVLEINGIMVFLYPKSAEFLEISNAGFIQFLEQAEKIDVGKVCGECECVIGKIIKR